MQQKMLTLYEAAALAAAWLGVRVQGLVQNFTDVKQGEGSLALAAVCACTYLRHSPGIST